MRVISQDVLTLIPNISNAAVKTTDLDVAAKSTLKNISKDTITVKWTRKIESITQGWSSAVCDKNLCYIPTVDTMKVVLAPGESSNMDIHIYPNNITGSAKISLKIERVGVPTVSVTGSYLFNQSTPYKTESNGEIQLFPNPSSDYFMVSSPLVFGKIEVYNITGQRAKTYYAYKNKRYYIDDLPSGIYMVRLLNLQEQIVKTVILKKR